MKFSPIVHLQTGSVDNLVVNNQLTATIIDDESADASTAITEGIADTVEQIALVNDGKTLLDITSFGHGNNTAILADVQNAVGLVDRAQHALDNDGGRGVRDEARLLMKLAGEKVDTKVTVLVSLWRDGDANDLTWAALEDQQITNAYKVAWDGDGVG